MCSCACVYTEDFCTVVAPELSGTGACIVINSTSAREQINGGCTVMECMVKGEADWMGEWRDRKQTQKYVNVGQERRKRGVKRGGEKIIRG